MFVGAPGSGKTATARHIALILQEEGYEILSINDIKDFETYYDPPIPQVFVIDDVLGKFNLDMKTYAFLNSHKETLLNLTKSKTKLILTCREQVYRSKKLSEFFFCKQENVVLLHDEENALDEEDKRTLLQMYGMERDILSSDLPASSLIMFPLLCKLASKRISEVRLDFFKSPISYIKEELNEMKIENDKHYASLVLLMANQNKLSKDIFDNESNADRERYFVERKTDFLSECDLSTQLESSMVMNALSEMEGTYTMRCRGVFTFLHESLFEVIAVHFGQRCPNLMLQYMSSDYVAKYIRLEKESTKELAHDYSNDLYIKLDQSQYRSLAVRLYKDVEDGEWSCVFGNVALKNPSVLQSFITLMNEKSYEDLYRVFLSELTEEKSKDDKISIDLNDKQSNFNNIIHFLYREGNQRAICWAIYYGHSDILKYIIDQILERNENVDDLFGNPINVHSDPDNIHDDRDSVISSVIDEIDRLIVLASLSDDYSTNDLIDHNIDNNSFTRDSDFLSTEKTIEFPGIFYWCKRTIKRKHE